MQSFGVSFLFLSIKARRTLVSFWGSSPKDAVKAVLGLLNLVLAASLLRDLITDSIRSVAPPSTLSLLLSTIYAGSISAQIFGIAAAALSERLHAMRVDMMRSLLSALTVLLASMIRVIVHVALRSDIIGECVALAMREPLLDREGIWGPAIAKVLPVDIAIHFCDIQYQSDSVYEVFVLTAVFLTSVSLIGTIVHDNISKDREEEAEVLIANYDDAEHEYKMGLV